MTELGYFAPGSPSVWYAAKVNETAIPPEQINAVLQTCNGWEKLRTARVIEPVSETWAERKRSNLVKFMMAGAGETAKSIGKYLDMSRGTFNCKLATDCFSFTELIALGYACGYSFQIVSPDGEPFLIDPVDYLKSENPFLLEVITALREKEYLQKKAEFEQMKEKYGFDD